MSAIQWDPIADSDKALKEAFSQLNASNDKVVIREEGRPNRFVLHSRSYYGQPQQPILSKMTLGPLAIKCSENTVTFLDQQEEISLMHNLQILLDPKYQSASDQDQTFGDAREAAQMVLEMLKQEAYDSQRQVEEVIGLVLRFKETTMRFLEDVKFLTRQFHTGPASNRSGETRPYLENLDGELTKAIKVFEGIVKEANDKNGEWQNATGEAVTTCWVDTLGFMALTAKAARSTEIRRGWDLLEEQIYTATRDRGEETVLVKLVSMMVYQCSGIESKMTTTINALTDLSALFQVQSDCYSKIRGALGNISRGTGGDSAATRRAFITFQMKETVQKLKELKELAVEFTRGTTNEIRL
ncbi:hypothetical protein ACJ41O_012885 [Fusarium nematophilum]